MRSDFDRRFNRTRSFIFAMFVLTLLGMAGVATFYVFVGYNLYQAGPEGIGEFIGSIQNGYENARESQ